MHDMRVAGLCSFVVISSNCPTVICLFSCLSLIYSLIQFATYSPSLTGTAFPMICSRAVLLPLKIKSFGKVCIKLLSFVVSGLTLSEISTGSPSCLV